MSPYYVYILKSRLKGTHYIGQTNDLDRRIRKHNKGQVQSTKNGKPFDLIYFEEFETRREVMYRQWYLKLKDGIEEKRLILQRSNS